MNDSTIKILDFDNYLKNNYIKIDIGCGPNKKEGCLGIDKIDISGVDIVANLENGLGFLPDNSVDEIYTTHFLEHIENFELMMSEFHRVLKPAGKAFIKVPHFSSPHYYSDFTHKRFFGYYTFYYFCENQTKIARKTPVFYTKTRFNIINQRFFFGYVIFHIKVLRKLAEYLFNMNTFTQELYERAFCFILPCKEIYIEISPVK